MAGKKKADSGRLKYSPALIELCRADFLAGKTLDDISTSRSVNLSSLKYYSKRDGWVQGREDVVDQVSSETNQRLIEHRVAHGMEVIAETEADAARIQRMAMERFDGQASQDPKNFMFLAKAYRDATETRLKVCGLNLEKIQITRGNATDHPTDDPSSYHTMTTDDLVALAKKRGLRVPDDGGDDGDDPADAECSGVEDPAE